MIKSWFNKYVRPLVMDAPFRWRFAAVVGLSFALIFQMVLLGKSQDAFRQAQKQKELVALIPEMKNTLRLRMVRIPSAQSQSSDSTLAAPEIILEGVTERGEGVFYALINGEVYKEGDVIGGYTVEEIEKDSAVLRNTQTHEIKNIYFVN